MPKEGSQELGNGRQEEEVGSSLWKLKVIAEIQQWSRQVLDRPSDHYNGLPPCPFARKAWADRKVKVTFGDKKEVIKQCLGWDESLDLLIVVTEDWEWGDIDEWCEGENEQLSDDDLTLMAFVPDSNAVPPGQPEEELEDWDPLIDEPYAMVFIQRLSAVNAASDKLERQGYYKNCSAEFLEYVTTRRERQTNARQAQRNERQEEGSDEEEGCCEEARIS